MTPRLGFSSIPKSKVPQPTPEPPAPDAILSQVTRAGAVAVHSVTRRPQASLLTDIDTWLDSSCRAGVAASAVRLLASVLLPLLRHAPEVRGQLRSRSGLRGGLRGAGRGIGSRAVGLLVLATICRSCAVGGWVVGWLSRVLGSGDSLVLPVVGHFFNPAPLGRWGVGVGCRERGGEPASSVDDAMCNPSYTGRAVYVRASRREECVW
ncbi:hypothetical protein GGS23DRAFT_507657 [Durotheca rogersii]|uniref:uncharacterized protein n=1 Tax=Durotheca rogersii TaxID=419775 RepID=UPI00222075D8|nr:uncharacterized protein GGS23DRAFT_507657 [Durotheca rogersii]KAI5863635.1 hypothetical protein GGS23DRAFT_507657 [Durotheca rogersii]